MKASSQKLVSEEKWMDAYYKLEITIRELMWYQSKFVLTFYNEYNSEVNVEGTNNSLNDLFELRDRIGWSRSELGSFKRGLRRSDELPSEDVARALEIVELFGKFTSAVENVEELLGESETLAAYQAFKDNSVPLGDEILASLFTLRRSAQDRFRDDAKNFR